MNNCCLLVARVGPATAQPPSRPAAQLLGLRVIRLGRRVIRLGRRVIHGNQWGERDAQRGWAAGRLGGWAVVASYALIVASYAYTNAYDAR